MGKQKSSISSEVYFKGYEIAAIGNKAVKKAQNESRQKGIPNVYSNDGKIFYELPTGKTTTKSPF